jgi:putative addiction module killer protein
MKNVHIVNYLTDTGKEPFSNWLDGLDNQTKHIVRARLNRIRLGNFGDCKQIKRGGGIWELRIDYGPGYRIYFGMKNEILVVLLIGGDKGSQARDLEKAKRYWLTYNKWKEKL